MQHLSQKVDKADKGILIIRKLKLVLPCSLLLTFYKSFVKPHWAMEMSSVISQIIHSLFRKSNICNITQH